jgi:hypothetical protein
VRKPADGQLAIGALITFALWIFVALPLYYGPRADPAAYNCSAKEEKDYGFWEKTRCDPVAYFTAWLVGFTGVLAASTIGLLTATWLAARKQSRDTAAFIGETRRIGEAQVRAYVDINKAEAFFIGFPGALHMGRQEIQPIVKVTATNTGQSPARNFVWNPTIEYISAGLGAAQPHTRARQLGANWRDILGVGIAVGQSHSDSAMVGEMPLIRFLQSAGNIDATAILIRLRVQFEFDDVFDRRISADAYFFGTAVRVPQPVATEFGQSLWVGTFTRMHRPNDWPVDNQRG